jgi:H+/Cl- antiporter ClcA
MKTFFRWGLIVAGIAVLAGIIYNIFLHIWPLHPFWGWRVHYFGPRIWPVFPLFGLLILFVAGILVAKYFFQALRDSSMPKKDELASCPYCGRDLRRGRAISEVQPEKL